jgi:hypothetical protein
VEEGGISLKIGAVPSFTKYEREEVQQRELERFLS